MSGSITQHRKERERAEREELILTHARRMLLEEGFQNLNLEDLARTVEYSKGTLYLHFQTKEDLTLAVATRTLRERASLFERANAFQGRARERIRAIGVACCEFARTHREYFHVELMLKSASFWEKASEERRRLHGLQAKRTFEIVNGIVQEAIRAGDLSDELSPTEITLSLIAITMGSHIVALQPDLQVLCGIADPLLVVRKNHDTLCDGWGWKPLLRDWDYVETDRRIQREVFPEAIWLTGGAVQCGGNSVELPKTSTECQTTSAIAGEVGKIL